MSTIQADIISLKDMRDTYKWVLAEGPADSTDNNVHIFKGDPGCWEEFAITPTKIVHKAFADNICHVVEIAYR